MGRVIGRPRSPMPPNSSELISAVGHPLRRRILLGYLEGSYDRTSAKEMADLLRQRVGKVAYHLKALANCSILTPCAGADRPGPERLYALAPGVEPEWLRLVLEVWVESDVRR